MNGSRKGQLGYNPAYMIHHGSIAYGPYDFENDPPFKRNRYLEYSLWNTVYDPDQRYAGGDLRDAVGRLGHAGAMGRGRPVAA